MSSPNIFSLHIQVGSNANRFIYITVSQSFAPSLSFLLFIECQRPGIFLFHLFNGIIPDLQPRGSIFRLPKVIFLKLIMRSILKVWPVCQESERVDVSRLLDVLHVSDQVLSHVAAILADDHSMPLQSFSPALVKGCRLPKILTQGLPFN